MNVDSYVTICLYIFSKSIASFIYLFRDVYYLSMCRLSISRTPSASVSDAAADADDDDVVHIFLLVQIVFFPLFSPGKCTTSSQQAALEQ